MNYETYHFKSLTSTQDKAKEFSRKGMGNLVVISDIQTKGRGRFKRKWFSSRGGLWMSILLRPKNTQKLQYLTFAASIAVAKTVKKAIGLDAKIKWPNDVHYKGKKLCGILTEGIFGKDNFVIVGIGLNVNQDHLQKKISDIATSLRFLSDKKQDIEKIQNGILTEFFELYTRYNKKELKPILEIWKKKCDTIGKEVKIATTRGNFKGIATGVDDECRLLVKTRSGQIKTFIEGDLTLNY